MTRLTHHSLISTLAAVSLSTAAFASWFENFDTYDTVTKLPNQSTWEAWGGAASAANFYASGVHALSGPNSVEIDSNDDAVHRYSGHSTGTWLYDAWLYVPQTMNDVQYFILLNTYPTGPYSDWSLQLEIDGANNVVADHNGPGQVALVKGQWAEIRVEIDLDQDTQSAYYNGNHIVTKGWTDGVQQGGAQNIAAVDLYANGSAHKIYYDDFALAPWNRGLPSFSIDFQGPTIGALPDPFFGMPITEADIMIPPPPACMPVLAPPPPPAIVVFGGPGAPGPHDLGLPGWAAAVGHPAGVPGKVEVDALSHGTDFNLDPKYGSWGMIWSFSVDEFAWGQPGCPFPSVATEGMVGAAEASADVFTDWGIGPGPFPPPPPFIFGNVDLLDGDGVGPFGGPGLGLAEPNVPVPGVPDTGDNLDAFDIDELAGPGAGHTRFPIFFSLDSAFIDPIEGPPVNTASASTIGFVGGDVLVAFGGGVPPAVFAPAGSLGLDIVGGPDSDDLDALIVWENGDGIYQQSMQPFDWISAGTDMLLFSVRRGSAVIGLPDSLWGAPIEEGDILCPPVAGGVSPFPGIVIPAEQIGLATARAAIQGPTGFADDLNAADLSPDCNWNFVPDALDIIWGLEQDVNANGIPDSCDCPEDINGDWVVDVLDLLAVLAAWGNPGGPEDVNADGMVDVLDLLAILAKWGPC